MAKTVRNRIPSLPLCLGAALLLTGFPPRFAVAQTEVDREFEFMSGLVEWSLPEYAEKALQKILLKHPELKDRAKVIEAEILIARKKFAEAEQLAVGLPAGDMKGASIRLAIANGYYRIGEIDKAKELYQAFFNEFGNRAPTDPDLKRFFLESAYTYGQMLEQAGDKAGALKAYDMVLAASTDREVVRPLMLEQARAYVDLARTAGAPQKEEHLKRAAKICEELQWKGIDVWFGQSVSVMANVELVRGNQDQALSVLDQNEDILEQIDQMMKDEGLSLAQSPMAGARFIRGEIYEARAQAAAKNEGTREQALDLYGKALKEFYTVFAKYGENELAPQAGVRANAIKQVLEKDFGKQVNINLPGGQTQVKVGPQQFRLGDTLYRQKKYAEAAAEYLNVLSQFPESDQTPRVLSNLAICYANLSDTLMVKVAGLYLGERFQGNNDAASALLLLGKHYFDAKDEGMYTWAYDTYLRFFPRHDRAAAILFTLAALKKQSGDQQSRLAYLQRIVQDFKQDQYYLRTLSLLGWEAYAAGDYETALTHFRPFVEQSQPGSDKAKAQFAIADCYLRANDYLKAIAEFRPIIQWLDPKDPKNPYNTDAKATKDNADVLEKTTFQIANCLGLVQAPPDKLAAIRDKAVQSFDHFLATYPASDLAPKAMAGKGRIQLALGQFEPATRTFEELATKFPDSEEGKSALYSLIKAAMEVGQLDVARGAFQKMMASAGSYSPAEFTRIGQLMLEVKAYPEAVQAFEQIQGKTEERALLERGLFGLGQAYSSMEDSAKAVAALEDLMQRYPQSGLFYDAKFLLAENYLKTGRFEEAIASITDVSKYASDNVLIVRATMRLAAVQLEQGDKEKAYASYQRVALLSDPGNADLRPFVETAVWKSVELGMELERYQDVQDSCDQYLQQFPRGEKIEDVRRLKREANMKATQQGLTPPAGNPPAP